MFLYTDQTLAYNPDATSLPDPTSDTNLTTLGENPGWRHFDQANCLFVDGHVKIERYQGQNSYLNMVGSSTYPM